MESERVRCLSPSELDTFRDCKARWYLEYVARCRPAKRPEMFRIGALTHATVAAHFRKDAQRRGLPIDGTTSPEEAIKQACEAEQWDEIKRTTEDDAELAFELGARIAKILSIKEGRFRPVVAGGYAMIERHLTMPLEACMPGVSLPSSVTDYYRGGMKGVLDFFGHDEERAGKEGILDLKIKAKSISKTDDLGPDPQLMIYQALCGYAGHWPDYAHQFRVRAVIPVEPQLTTRKPIKLSTSRTPPVSLETFLAACDRHKFNPADYENFVDFLTNKRRFHQAAFGGASKAEVAHCLADALADACMMAEIATRPADGWTGGHIPATRNRRTFDGSPCLRCAWYVPCGATYGRDFVVACTELVRDGKSGTLESLVVIEDDDEGEEI